MSTEREETERMLREIEALRSRVTSLEKKETPNAGEPDGGTGPPSDTTGGKPEARTFEEREQASRALLNATADSALLIDNNGIILDANDNMAASVGKSRESILGTVIYDYFPPALAEQRKARESEAARKKQLIRFEDHRDGRWLENSVYPVFDSRGELVQFAVFSHDITHRKQIEQSLKQERDKTSTYLDLAEVILMALDKNGCITLINRKGCHILEYPHDQLIGKNFFDTFIPDGIKTKIQEVFQDILKEQSFFQEYYENPILTKSGEKKIIAWHNTALKDENGQITGTLSSGEDITKRKMTEKALLESERYYRTLFESASDAVFIMEQTHFVECNQKVLKLFGCTREQILGKTPADFSPPFQPDGQNSREKAGRILEKVADGSPQFFEWRHQRYDGELFDAEVNLDPLNIQDKKRFIAIVRDITERKKAEEALNSALAEVRRMKESAEAENVYLNKEIRMAHIHGDIVGQSAAIKSVLSLAEQVAETDSTVLILGETGTGKELLARAIHNMSSRKDRPLVIVNCAAIPGTLVESELFGREKGAFTGASARQIGRFEIAHGSTIFLDEIGELSPDVQVKLLRVIQEGQFERLGSTRTIRVDVRIIAATNRDLEQEMRAGNFREDLFYRLNVFPISLPPLRDRKEDIPMLVWNFVNEMGEKMGKIIEKIPQPSIDALLKHDWPGNIRELHNVIERAMIQAQDNILRVPPVFQPNQSVPSLKTLVEVEKKHLIDVLEQTDWRIRGENGAAEILGIKPTTLESRMLKYGIKRPS
ncbi:MAG: sigma 54-interacting transcriptional regulator [Acidobacteria bacterium]|nr:sigma 54-interacting transcriptional regulator [Acidobacteriota bacterium]